MMTEGKNTRHYKLDSIPVCAHVIMWRNVFPYLVDLSLLRDLIIDRIQKCIKYVDYSINSCLKGTKKLHSSWMERKTARRSPL